MTVQKIEPRDEGHREFLVRRAIEWLDQLTDDEALLADWTGLKAHLVEFLES